MSDFEEYLDKDRRLIVLRSLHEQVGCTLNEALIQKALEIFAHRVTRTKVKSILRFLEEAGAVRITEVGGILIATLTQDGADHVERRRKPIDGISVPSLGS